MEAPPPFVPDSFELPPGLVSAEFVLEPLGPQHDEADHAACIPSASPTRTRLPTRTRATRPSWRAVCDRLRQEWPFEHVAYAPRP